MHEAARLRTIEAMTSIFGHFCRGAIGASGRPGIAHAPGESGLVITCKWLPKTLLQQFRENDEWFCLMLTDLSPDVKMSSSPISSVVSRNSRDSGKHVFILNGGGGKGKLIRPAPGEKRSAIHFQGCV